jgi:MoxR-like ATPase
MVLSRAMNDTAASQVQRFRQVFARVQDEIGRVMVGQRDIVEGVLVAFFAGGHVLLEGVPGLGKTMLVRTLGEAVNLKFARIQFTPDLMPSDIVGTNIIVEDEQGKKSFRFEPGAVFANLVLADEINRATPKTQSALLESMQENHVTVGGVQHPLAQPFLVLATQNPLEMEGTYPLPEAQLDRFFFKLKVPFPTAEDLHTILDRTTTAQAPAVEKVLHEAADVTAMREVVRQVPIAREVQDHAVVLTLATHPDQPSATPLTKKYVRYGASPRGSQAMILAAKIFALLEGRYHVAKADIDRAAPAALRHRIIMNFEGEAEGKTSDEVIAEIVARSAG